LAERPAVAKAMARQACSAKKCHRFAIKNHQRLKKLRGNFE
jgi:hypothetical protein